MPFGRFRQFILSIETIHLKNGPSQNSGKTRYTDLGDTIIRRKIARMRRQLGAKTLIFERLVKLGLMSVLYQLMGQSS